MTRKADNSENLESGRHVTVTTSDGQSITIERRPGMTEMVALQEKFNQARTQTSSSKLTIQRPYGGAQSRFRGYSY